MLVLKSMVEEKAKRTEPPQTHVDMVLLWRADASSQANTASLVFEGKKGADVSKFRFVYANVLMTGKSDTDKAGELPCFL